jgi:hypothetical protein
MIGMNNLGRNGRLGNQMFQYAALVGIAKNRGFDFVIPDCSSAKSFDYHNGHSVVTVYHQLQHCFEMNYCNGRYGLIDGDEVDLHESHEFCQELFDECPDNVSLNGYFETEKYFKNAEEEVKLDYQFKKEILDQVDYHFESHLNQNPVAIVVRHFSNDFDHFDCEKSHRNISFEYFGKAIELMGKDRTYIICSNNIELCKNQKEFEGKNFIFNEINPEKIHKAHFDLCLISKCSDFIISNSTFAWWGAWLGQNKNKKVVSPYPWYGETLIHIKTKDLYPDSWIKIDC